MFSFPVAHFNKHVIRFGEKFIYALFCLQLAHATAIKGNDDKGMSLCQVATVYSMLAYKQTGCFDQSLLCVHHQVM